MIVEEPKGKKSAKAIYKVRQMNMEQINSMKPQAPRTLIADDQPDILAALGLLLKGEGYYTEAVTSPAAVLEAIQSKNYDVVLMDLNYARDTTSGQEGLDLLTSIHALDNTLPVVVMTAWGTVELAVEAMRRGVGDFVQKPWENERLLNILRSQVELGHALRKSHRLEEAKKRFGLELSGSQNIHALLQLAAEHINGALQKSVVVFTRSPREHAFRIVARAGF
jgi:DNA-binding NtrC family response regulator